VRALGRSMAPEFVQMLQDIGRSDAGLMDRSVRGVLSAIVPGEDEFFRPKAPTGIGYRRRSE